jgi:hypothetical protein
MIIPFPSSITLDLKILIFHGIKILLLILFIFPTAVSAQVKPKKDLTYTVEPYEKRIQLEYINNVYIPKDLSDALKELDQKIDAAGREKFALMSEEDAGTKVYFSFGRWMSVNWGMEEGSRITHYFNSQGIAKLEDMIRILMLSYHRHINQKELRTDELFKHYKDLRKKEYEAYLERVRKEGKDTNGGN